MINIKYAPIPPDPQNPSHITRGRTNYNDATYLNGRLESVPITINTAVTDPTAITEVIAHEIGHIVLQSGRHTPNGLMRASYPGADLIEPGRRQFVIDVPEPF